MFRVIYADSIKKLMYSRLVKCQFYISSSSRAVSASKVSNYHSYSMYNRINPSGSATSTFFFFPRFSFPRFFHVTFFLDIRSNTAYPCPRVMYPRYCNFLFFVLLIISRSFSHSSQSFDVRYMLCT